MFGGVGLERSWNKGERERKEEQVWKGVGIKGRGRGSRTGKKWE